jgi:hypothetical protein
MQLISLQASGFRSLNQIGLECVDRSMATTDSDLMSTTDSGVMSSTHSGVCRPPIPLHAVHF